jgi:Protein of unknown function (DUF3302)
MSILDLFAAVVLAVVIVSIIAAVLVVGALPGWVARRRNHPAEQAVRVAGWVTLICGFVLWPVAMIWAYVDIPARPAVPAAAGVRPVTAEPEQLGEAGR